MLYFILGWLCVCLCGCMLHFAFDWTHHNKFLAWFPAVNESVWEHLKIAFWPFLIWGVLGLIFNLHNIWFATFVGACAVFATILILFYSYTLFTKHSILIVDIISFFVAIGVGVMCAYFLTTATLDVALNLVGIVGLVALVFVFVAFSYCPPHNFLFKDPINHNFGIEGHNGIMCHHHHCHHCEMKEKNKKMQKNKKNNYF